MLLLNIALLVLSVLPTSLAKKPRHHRTHSTHSISASTFSTLPSTSNSTANFTIPLTTTIPPSSTTGGAPVGHACPTITKTVAKTAGVCPDIRCLPVLVGGSTPVTTSTSTIDCGCPAATPTETLSLCDTGCERLTSWLFKTAGAC